MSNYEVSYTHFFSLLHILYFYMKYINSNQNNSVLKVGCKTNNNTNNIYLMITRNNTYYKYIEKHFENLCIVCLC